MMMKNELSTCGPCQHCDYVWKPRITNPKRCANCTLRWSPRKSLRERFEENFIVEPGGCWIWTGATFSTGYGEIRVGNTNKGAHRISYELHVGKIPKGLELDHLCKTPLCVNWRHLEPVTKQENWKRGDSVPRINMDKTQCIRGHIFDEKNTYVYSHGARECRACRKIHYQERTRRIGATD